METEDGAGTTVVGMEVRNPELLLAGEVCGTSKCPVIRKKSMANSSPLAFRLTNSVCVDEAVPGPQENRTSDPVTLKVFVELQFETLFAGPSMVNIEHAE